MQGRGRIFDDLAQIINNAMGVAQGAKAEAETALRSWFERWLADRDLVTREEFEAVRRMAEKAREENDALSARLDALEKEVEMLQALVAGKDAGKAKGGRTRSTTKAAGGRSPKTRRKAASGVDADKGGAKDDG